MKFNLCVLCLFFAISFVLNSSPPEKFEDGVERTIDLSNEKLCIRMKIPKSGYINLSLKEAKIHKLDKKNFKFGLSPSEEINNANDNNITFVNLTDEYKISFYAEKGNNEYVIVNIESLTKDNKVTIKLTFFPQFQGSIIIAIILVALNVIFFTAFVIFQNCFNKRKDLK